MTSDADNLIEFENGGLPEDVGKLIKEYRLKKGYSLAQLDKLAKVSPSYISRIERSLRNEVSFSKVLRICFSLGIPYEELVSKAFGEIVQTEAETISPTFADILFHSEFTIQETKADIEIKEILVSMISFIFECTWDSKTKINDLYQVSKKIEKLKGLL
ncbi:helix-turn-helix domain-containing protein [Cytobacillus horneckiae]|uniref:helix-turn-helix domain-containing protein n=1 Tax=Cytobacillus horneckiae TaxID=549687 RepID=UPI002DB8B79F|nr:helix-turn-helix transcriptional regulator [Cytobacillus horneckiae]MEC1157832.1 helix-turn-helix transcriptional regulator [Cytobacillus horneckiae]MED2940726.1 helix-turn-helix transcriptional regulator [Cytobacillus horneckiae]